MAVEAGVEMIDPVRGAVQLVTRALDVGTAPVRELARLGSDSLLAALLALLRDTDPEPDAAAEPPDAADGRLPPGEIITRGLLDGHGRYTRLDVAERTGIPPRKHAGCGAPSDSPKYPTISGSSPVPTSPP